VTIDKGKADFLMLARRAKRQKPCPALSFQNAEQGFLSKTKLRLNYGFAGVAAGAVAAAGVAAGAAPPPSFGVAR
jgi:hypothetical protein